MANADLQQINGTPRFPSTAAILTDEYLVPTDGPVVTAASNAAGQAPVKPALVRAKDLILGLRGGIIGDFAGAVQKTVRSFYADATGGNTHTYGPGIISALNELWAETGNITAFAGDVICMVGKAQIRSHVTSEIGNVVALVGRVQALAGNVFAGDIATPAYGVLSKAFVAFVGTMATGSNPVRGVSTVNQLVAKNIPKHWGRVSGSAGALVIHAGCGAWSAAIVDLGAGPVSRWRLRITMTDVMDTPNYSPVCQALGPDNTVYIAVVHTDTMTTSVFDIALWGPVTGAQGFRNIVLNDFDVSFHVMGQQTT